MGSLNGRVAVVTGGGRGIGASVARLFAAEGAAVVVNDLGVDLDGTGRETGPAQQVVSEITEAGGTAVADFGDITDHTAAEKLIRAAVDRFGKLDVLVNVAGILRDRMIFNMSEDEWDAVVRVHLRGTFNTTKHAAAYWRSLRDSGAHHRLINFTSASGLFGAAGQPNYAAAKMGVVGLTYSCANALRRFGVTANAVSPDAVTRMVDSIPGEHRNPRTAARTPENIAPIVAYIAGTASGWLNGQVVGAKGHQITLFGKPEPIRQIVSTGPWQPDQLAELVEQTFRPVVDPSAAPRGANPSPGGRTGDGRNSGEAQR